MLRVTIVTIYGHLCHLKSCLTWLLPYKQSRGIDDGIRLEPFNMRREMREGHFDESGFYVLNKALRRLSLGTWQL